MDPSNSDHHDPKQQQQQKIVMGYPSMDRYHTVQQNQMYPPQAAPVAAYPLQPYAATSSSSFHNYASPSSFHHHHHYPGSSKYQVPPPGPYSGGNNNVNMSTYYNYQPSYKHLIPENDSHRFGRIMLTLMVVLVASMCMMSLVMWFLFGTYLPDFEVVSLRVDNFTVGANGTLSGVWDADVAVRNANQELVVRFERVRSSVFYKEVLLGLSSVQPFQVDHMQQTEVAVSVPADKNPNSGGNNFQKLQNWLVPTFEKDRANGLVFFSLRLAMRANFTSPTIVYRRESMRVMCDDLPVQLLPSGEGKLAPGPTHPCLIRIRDTMMEDE